MVTIRHAAAAGALYPAEAWELRRMVSRWLGAPPDGASAPPAPRALVVPHTAYVYGGSLQGLAFARLWPARHRIRRVVLVGPSHFVPFYGIAVPSATAFATPLGLVPVDRSGVRAVLPLPSVIALDEAHAYEHSIELQLPFLQDLLSDFAVVPLALGEAASSEVEAVLDAVGDGPDTVVILSTALGPAKDPEAIVRLTLEMGQAVERLDFGHPAFDAASGAEALRALVRWAGKWGLAGETIGVGRSPRRNLPSSNREAGDGQGTAGTDGRREQGEVIGFGAFAFSPPNRS